MKFATWPRCLSPSDILGFWYVDDNGVDDLDSVESSADFLSHLKCTWLLSHTLNSPESCHAIKIEIYYFQIATLSEAQKAKTKTLNVI